MSKVRGGGATRRRLHADGGIDLGLGLAREDVERQVGLHRSLRLVNDLGDAQVDGDARMRPWLNE